MNTNIINKLSTLIKSSLNEGFDFDNELESDDSDSVISKDIASKFVFPEKNIQIMNDNKIDVKYVLLNYLHLDLGLSNLNLSWSDFKSFKETISRLEILHQTIGIFDFHNFDYNQLLINNNWMKLTYDLAIRLNEIHDIVDTYNECYMTYREACKAWYDETTPKLEIYISPDKGVVYIANDLGTIKGKILLNYLGVFLLTGYVRYKKIKKRALTLSEIDIKCMEFWKYLLARYNELVSPTNHYKIIYDKNGYPRLAAVVHHHLIYGHNMPKCIRYTHADGWTESLTTGHPHVAIRKDTLDGLVEVGVFMPWELPKELDKKPLYIYNLPSLCTKLNYESLYSSEPLEFGILVFLLSKQGLCLFDQFKSNNYRISLKNKK